MIDRCQYKLPNGATYEQLAQEAGVKGAVACFQDHLLWELSTPIQSDAPVEFIGVEHPDGEKIYQRSVIFLFIRSAMEVFEGVRVKISHSLSKGVFCELNWHQRKLTTEDYGQIKRQMLDYVEQELPISSRVFPVDQAKEIFARQQMESKRQLLNYRKDEDIRLYELDGQYDYFYGYMLPNTSYLTLFDLMKYGEGVILRHPTSFSPIEIPAFEESPKLAKVFREMEDWLNILGISYVYNLNEHISLGAHKELIQMAEALHEKKISDIADDICKQKKRVILIAGPSSSGKTTFASRLRIQLRVNGAEPLMISTDNYFVDRQLTPLDENGQYDFECLEAVDVEQFNRDLNDLLDGKEVLLPVFDFKTGVRGYAEKAVRIGPHQPIIVEGIHGLNESLTKKVFRLDKYKIYISALTQLNIDEHNRIPTTQARLLRRIVRDRMFRGHSAEKTILMWPSVRRGEEKYIFPFQEEADMEFNSAMPYELAVLKKHAIPALEEIPLDSPAYQTALLLRKFLGYFESIEDDQLVPQVSILKEFIGGSGFEL